MSLDTEFAAKTEAASASGFATFPTTSLFNNQEKQIQRISVNMGLRMHKRSYLTEVTKLLDPG